METFFYDIALTLVPHVGPVIARNLLNHFGSAEEVLKAKKRDIERVSGVGSKISSSLMNSNVYKRAEQELLFIQQNQITPLKYSQPNYPVRLKKYSDAPLLLYYKGGVDLNTSRIISVVGTRKATAYGKSICEELISELVHYQPVIVSGLAYGIDSFAHKNALTNQLLTIGVLGHGLDLIYPHQHKSIAEHMVMSGGGLLTEFVSKTKPDRENFPMRNRIIAGLSDAVVVVEARETGGALITAEIADSYNTDVFAFPGRVHDECSKGCNKLISNHKATMITSASDVARLLGWNQTSNTKEIQRKLIVDFNQDEQQIVSLLLTKQTLNVDDILMETNFNMSKLATVLLNLEMNGVIRCLPGKVYELV